MSAWIVSEKHIMTLAYNYLVFVKERDEPTDAEIMEVAKVLLKENVKSVNFRYGDKNRSRFSKKQVAPDKTLSIAGLVKAIHCWEYQTCEHDGHEKSKAWVMMQQLQTAILSQIFYTHQPYAKEYEDAKWGLSE